MLSLGLNWSAPLDRAEREVGKEGEEEEKRKGRGGKWGVGEERGTESREWLDSPSMTVVMLEKLRTQWLPSSGSSLP